MPDKYGRPVARERVSMASVRLASVPPAGLPLAIRTARHAGMSWADIATVVGKTMDDIRRLQHQ